MNSADAGKQWLELINKRDAKDMVRIYARDVVIHDPGLPEPLRGADNWQKNAEEIWWKAFPDLKFELQHLVADKDTCMLELVLVGTHKGPLPGPAGEIPATNKPFRVPGVGILRVNDQGLIVDERRYYDTAGFMQQLGIGAPAAAAATR